MNNGPNRVRHGAAALFAHVEHAFYLAIAAALALGGAVLFGQVVYAFATQVVRGNVAGAVLRFLDGTLLVFIIAELIHTIRTVVDENVLRTEPFLIVGIVAAIRRILVITAEAREHLGRPEFHAMLLEASVLAGTVLVLGITIFLMRHTARTEPSPREEGPGAAPE